MALNDLDLPALRTQRFNATPPGTMQAAPSSPAAPVTYAEPYAAPLPTGGGRPLTDMLGAALNFLFNKPGAGGLLDASRVDPVPPQPATTAGGPDRAGGPQAMPPGETPAASRVTRRVAAPAAAAAGAAPAAQALVPGETGYYLNGKLVPYGPDLLGAPGGPSGMIDPAAYFADMVRTQRAFADRATDDILTKFLQNGSPRGGLQALAAVYNNGLAQAGMSGANTLNQVTGSMANEASRASAARDVAKTQLTGDLARSAAMNYSADLQYDAAAERNALDRYKLETDTVPGGSEMVQDPVTKMFSAAPTYIPRSKVSAMPAPYEQRQASKPKEGATGKTPDGRAVTYKNGQWVAQ